MTSAGRFLTFEGCEGCGKSTQITSTLAWLRSAKLTVHEVREPGGTPVGEVIRHLLKHDPVGQSMTAETELLLFAASRAELVRQTILPALTRGEWIIADRFHDSPLSQSTVLKFPSSEGQRGTLCRTRRST